MKLLEPPPPAEIDHAPELAVLYVLDASLEAARRTLAAARASLGAGSTAPDDEHSPRVRLGIVLLALADALQNTLRVYRDATEDERAEPDAELDSIPY